MKKETVNKIRVAMNVINCLILTSQFGVPMFYQIISSGSGALLN